MDIEQLLLWIAAAAFLVGAITGVVAHLKWMEYSKSKDSRRVSLTLSACVIAYGVAIASMGARLVLQGAIEEAVTGGIILAVSATCLVVLARRSIRAGRR